MAHVMKFTKGSVGTMTRHFERAKNTNGNYIKFGNQEIDTTKSHLNYNLHDLPGHQLDNIQKRLDTGVYCHNRKDVNILCSWIVTAPKDLLDEDQKTFFKENYKFLCNRYGTENCISAYVHMDETTPHMHFAFMPIAWDEKRQRKTVSAKKILNRADLQSFHKDLENHMMQVFGHNIGILNEATKNGNKSIEELKRNSAEEQIAKIQEIAKENIHASQNILADAKHQAAEMLQNVVLKTEKMDKALKDLKQEEKVLQGKIGVNKRTLDSFHEIEALGKSGIFGKLVLTTEEAQRLKEQAKAYFSQKNNAEKIEIEAGRMKEQLKSVKQSASYQENEKLRKEIKNLKNTIYDLQQSNLQMASSIQDLNEIFRRNPALSKEFRETEKIMRQEQQSHSMEMEL